MYSQIKKLSVQSLTKITTRTTAYASGQVIGGVNIIPNFFDSTSGVNEIVDCEVFDLAKQNSPLLLVLFSAAPTGTYTDGTTFAPNATDLLNVDAVISIPSGAYDSFSANSIATLSNLRNKIGANYNPQQNGPNSVARSAWLVVVSQGTPTYGITNGLAVQFGIEQDV